MKGQIKLLKKTKKWRMKGPHHLIVRTKRSLSRI